MATAAETAVTASTEETYTCKVIEVLKTIDDKENLKYTINEFEDWKTSVKSEEIENEKEKIIAKTDGLMRHKCPVIDEDKAPVNLSTSLVDSEVSDYTSEEESEDEYMSDGEVMRKNSRGFKQLVNCRKLWVASQMMGKRAWNKYASLLSINFSA